MTQWWGQQKEDMYLDRVFGDLKNGIFLDIGAFDGVEMSNTFYFEQRGWQGLCVEPNRDTFEKLVKNRTCNCMWAQIGDHIDEKAPFFVTETGHLSSSDPTYRDRWQHWYGDYLRGWKEVTAPMLTMDRLLTLGNPTLPGMIDLVSIDTEGSEWPVMHEWNLVVWKPRIVVIEINELLVMDKILGKFYAAGYQQPMKQSTNYFFCREPQDAQVLVDIQNGRIAVGD